MNLPLIAALLTFAAPQASPPVKVADPPTPSKSASVTPTLSLDLNRASLYESLKAIFAQVKLPYSIEPGVPDVTISVFKAANQPLPQTLQRLLAAARTPALRLSYEVRNGTYTIRALPVTQTENLGTGVTKFRLKHITASELLDYLERNHIARNPGIDGLVADPTNRVLIASASDPNALDGIVKILALVDVATEQETLTAELAVAIVGKDKISTAIESVVTGIAGEEMLAEDTTFGIPAQAKAQFESGQKGASEIKPEQQSRLKARVVVRPMGNGDYLVESLWDVSLNFPGAKGTQIRLEKTLGSTRKVTLGRTLVLGSVLLDGDQTASGIPTRVQFQLTLLAAD
jgi:hypothetical protein